MQPRLTIGFLSQHNPYDRHAFSGTAFHLFHALARRSDIEMRVLGSHRPPSRGRALLRRFGVGRDRPLDPDALDLSGLDWIIGLAATDLLHALLTRTGPEMVHVTDATPSFIRSFYGAEVSDEAQHREGEVVRKAALSVYSSRYMADRALAEFGPDPARIAAVPFGVNLEVMPAVPPVKPPLAPLRLLWVGNDWTRKGGQIALDTLSVLRDAGQATTLSLVGDVPQHLTLPPGAERLGYLDKNRPQDAARLDQLFAEAHLFVLPTRADCTPMVVAEANANATPVLITQTGGIGSLMVEGQNGQMMSMEAGPQDWADAIRTLTGDPDRYGALCLSSFEHAQTRLTWEAWGRDVIDLMRRAGPA
ncbi:MAG: glycosyltransferase family 4 protein [Pseudodonghicola sp.]|nr:glycosyltransferase family 4 protein [Pseudodonghicola sp.]